MDESWLVGQVKGMNDDNQTAKEVSRLAKNGYVAGQTINVNGGWYMS